MRPLQLKMPTQVCWCHLSLTCSTVWKSGTKAKVTNSVAKGVLDVKNTRNVGGIVAKTWPYGAVQDNVTYAKVIKGQEIFASNDVNDEDGGPYIKDLFWCCRL